MAKFSGQTVVSSLLALGVLVSVVTVLFRVIPVYLEHFNVQQAITHLADIPPEELSPNPLENVHLLKAKFNQQMLVNQSGVFEPKVFSITPENAKTYKVVLQYEVKKPLIGNVYLLFIFDEQNEVKFGV